MPPSRARAATVWSPVGLVLAAPWLYLGHGAKPGTHGSSGTAQPGRTWSRLVQRVPGGRPSNGSPAPRRTGSRTRGSASSSRRGSGGAGPPRAGRGGAPGARGVPAGSGCCRPRRRPTRRRAGPSRQTTAAAGRRRGTSRHSRWAAAADPRSAAATGNAASGARGGPVALQVKQDPVREHVVAVPRMARLADLVAAGAALVAQQAVVLDVVRRGELEIGPECDRDDPRQRPSPARRRAPPTAGAISAG